MNKLQPPEGYSSWLEYAIARMDCRGAFAEKMFDGDMPTQDEIWGASQVELDQLLLGLPAKFVDDINQSIEDVKGGKVFPYKFGESK